MSRRSETNALQALCLALDGRDVGPLTARLDDASVLHVPGFSGLGGDYQGGEAIVGFIQQMSAATDWTLRFEVRHTSTSRPSVLRIQGRLLGSRSGRPFSTTVSVDATLADQVFQGITIGCTDRSTWDALWGRPRAHSETLT